MKGFANDDHELAAALTMLEIKGGVFVFVPLSAGGNFKDGYYHVFYRTARRYKYGAQTDSFEKSFAPTEAHSAMIRKVAEVYAILEKMENGGSE